jgi:NADH-quinone oxidoreductase subunit M
MWHGPLEREENRAVGDLTGREWAILAPLVAAIVVLGLFPRPVLERVEPSATRVVEQTRQQGP